MPTNPGAAADRYRALVVFDSALPEWFQVGGWKSEDTVNFHLQNAIIKLDALNRTNAVAIALSKDYIGLNLNTAEDVHIE